MTGTPPVTKGAHIRRLFVNEWLQIAAGSRPVCGESGS